MCACARACTSPGGRGQSSHSSSLPRSAGSHAGSARAARALSLRPFPVLPGGTRSAMNTPNSWAERGPWEAHWPRKPVMPPRPRARLPEAGALELMPKADLPTPGGWGARGFGHSQLQRQVASHLPSRRYVSLRLPSLSGARQPAELINVRQANGSWVVCKSGSTNSFIDQRAVSFPPTKEPPLVLKSQPRAPWGKVSSTLPAGPCPRGVGSPSLWP